MRRVLMLTLFLLPAAALAAPPCSTTCPPAYVAPVYAAPVQVVYQPTYVLPFVVAPSYWISGLSYPDPQVEDLRQRVEDLEGAKVPQGVTKESAVSVLTASCVRCHSAGVAATKGGGLTFDPEALTVEQRRAVLDVVLSGSMPKGGPPITGTKRAAVLAGLVQ